MLSKRMKAYFKLNIVSILFAVVSLTSVTLAWFAYSGLVDVKTEVGVKAWYIEFEKNNEVVSNDIVISLSDIYPGMEPVKEVITIKNLGDADAKLKYQISQARILDIDSYGIDNETTSSDIEDILSHNYPFHINVSVSKTSIMAHGEDAEFEVSISWPLDSGNDALDSLWGTRAYAYDKNQKALKEENSEYVVKPSIKMVINVSAEQAIEDLKSSDINFPLGKMILYDINANEECSIESESCIKTYVIDRDNFVEDDYVSLLPSLDIGTYSYNDSLNVSTNWNVSSRNLTVSDILKVISLDIDNSLIKINGVSDMVIGSTIKDARINNIFTYVNNLDGYFEYNTARFNYLSSEECVWASDGYAYKLIDGKTRLYKEVGNCKVIPIINAPKANLEVE